MPILCAACLQDLKLSIMGDQGLLWYAKMMKWCLSDAVPDYAERVTRSLVLSKSVSGIKRVDTEYVLGTWDNRWMECWPHLPEDP